MDVIDKAQTIIKGYDKDIKYTSNELLCLIALTFVLIFLKNFIGITLALFAFGTMYLTIRNAISQSLNVIDFIERSHKFSAINVHKMKSMNLLTKIIFANMVLKNEILIRTALTMTFMIALLGFELYHMKSLQFELFCATFMIISLCILAKMLLFKLRHIH